MWLTSAKVWLFAQTAVVNCAAILTRCSGHRTSPSVMVAPASACACNGRVTAQRR
jgi:hypothetical protein